MNGDTLLRQEVEARIDEDGRDAMAEMMRDDDPACSCYSTTDNNGVLHPEYCRAHKIEAMAAQIAFGYLTYLRAFERECDARDREHIVLHMIRREDVRAQVVQVGRFWLVLAAWGQVKLKCDAWPS